MKILILVTLIGAAVGQLGQGLLYPGLDLTIAQQVIAKCTYWQGVESSICHTYRFNKDSRTLNDFRQNYHMYGMMNNYNKLFGNAQMQPEACSDAPKENKYWKACPALYNADLIDTTGDTNVWEILSGCASNETKCEMSCNLCGEENYITAAKEVEKKTNLRCLKIMDHFPFSCMEKKVVETPLPSVFVIYLNEVVLDATMSLSALMCVTFNYRRRASSDCPLESLSEIAVCESLGVAYSDFEDSPNQNCQLTQTAFEALTSPPEFRTVLNDNNHCRFNVWRKAYFTFFNNVRAGATNNELIGTELQIVVYRNVDHVDIDEVEIFPGICADKITADDAALYNGNPVLGAFIGIKDIE